MLENLVILAPRFGCTPYLLAIMKRQHPEANFRFVYDTRDVSAKSLALPERCNVATLMWGDGLFDGGDTPLDEHVLQLVEALTPEQKLVRVCTSIPISWRKYLAAAGRTDVVVERKPNTPLHPNLRSGTLAYSPIAEFFDFLGLGELDAVDVALLEQAGLAHAGIRGSESNERLCLLSTATLRAVDSGRSDQFEPIWDRSVNRLAEGLEPVDDEDWAAVASYLDEGNWSVAALLNDAVDHGNGLLEIRLAADQAWGKGRLPTLSDLILSLRSEKSDWQVVCCRAFDSFYRDERFLFRRVNQALRMNDALNEIIAEHALTPVTNNSPMVHAPLEDRDRAIELMLDYLRARA